MLGYLNVRRVLVKTGYLTLPIVPLIGFHHINSYLVRLILQSNLSIDGLVEDTNRMDKNAL